MEFLDQLWSQIAQYVNVPYLLTFMLLTYFVRHNWTFRIKTTYVVLIIATLCAVPYFFIVGIEWNKLLFSYVLGTSLHELLFKWIENKLKSL